MERTNHRISIWKEDALAALTMALVMFGTPYLVLALERVPS